MKTLLLLLLVSLGSTGCTEPNPDYDPDFVPPCSVGSVRCNVAGDAILVCRKDPANPDRESAFELDKTCWAGTQCTEGYCGAPAERICAVQTECAEGEVCTALPNSRHGLATYCIAPPYPEGREAGQICSRSEQCRSGYCFRQTCFTPCRSVDECPDGTECVDLAVTVDAIKGTIKGCALPN